MFSLGIVPFQEGVIVSIWLYLSFQVGITGFVLGWWQG